MYEVALKGKEFEKTVERLQEEELAAAAGTEYEKEAEQLRDIVKVLRITENTDINIKESIESILRIAERLDRRNTDGKG
jgi:hypothetical protein